MGGKAASSHPHASDKAEAKTSTDHEAEEAFALWREEEREGRKEEERQDGGKDEEKE